MGNKTKVVVYGAIIAAMYAVLTLVSSAFGLASGVIQIRISEALTILPIFTPYAIGGLFAGCLISNIITGCALWDTIFGSIATLIGALITYYIGKLKFKNARFLSPLGAIISNTCIIPFILVYVYDVKEAFAFIFFTVGIGELISAGILGTLLMISLWNHRNRIFK